MSFSGDNQKILRGTFNLGHPINANSLQQNFVLDKLQYNYTRYFLVNPEINCNFSNR